MASNFTDIRRYPRVNVDGGFCLQCQVGNRRYFGLRVTSLGGGGCSFRVPLLLAEQFKEDALLSRLIIEHPQVPVLLQKAKITWVLRETGQEDTAVRVGIEYIDPDLDFVQALDRCVASLASQTIS